MARPRWMWSDADGSGRSRPVVKQEDCFFCHEPTLRGFPRSHTINIVKGVLATDADHSWKMRAMKEIGDNDMGEIVVCKDCIDRIVGSFALLKKGAQIKEEE